MIDMTAKRFGWLSIALIFGATISYSSLRDRVTEDVQSGPKMSTQSNDSNDTTAVAPDADNADAAKSQEEMTTDETKSAPAANRSKSSRSRVDRADAFVAGPDWEFDGFVAGGQDSNVRSMFYLNDLVYLNIGGQQGINIGDRIGIYKRGDKVYDPQTGKFIGYEVRRAAYAKATDRVEDDTCAIRITSTFEAVEIGDLVRREQ
jgi:hypothetical protein